LRRVADDGQEHAMSSSSDNGGIAFALFAAGPAAGVGTWVWIQAKYRNRSARYMPERVVKYEAKNLKADDAFVKHIVSRSSSIEGRNDGSPHVRAAYTKTTKE
jgi:hypothetical protein